MLELFPCDGVPRYVLHDGDPLYGESLRKKVPAMGIREVPTAPQSPWQNPYVKRLIGSICRERLGHIIVFDESSVRLRVFGTSETYLALFQVTGHSPVHPGSDPMSGLDGHGTAGRWLPV